jgi:hypothetical protein
VDGPSAGGESEKNFNEIDWLVPDGSDVIYGPDVHH